MKQNRTCRPMLWSAAVAMLVGCASTPEPFVKDAQVDVEATVASVDAATRMVVLNGPNGPATIVAGPQVINFEQIRVGDIVRVTYYTGIAAQITKKSSADGTPVQSTETYLAPPGSRPGAGVGRSTVSTVKIESVDTSLNTVTFKRSDGFVRTLAVDSPEGRQFIKTLRPGDEVEVTYTEAVAVAVVPASEPARR